MEKCVTVPYLEALTHVLANEPAAWLILAGRDAFGALQTMQQHFSAHGVWNRVKYLGPRQQDGPRLLKTIDVYCDTYPWPGGQTLLDAMQAGVPIVAMRRSNDRDLDPTGEGSTTALADVLLSGVVDLADAGNARAYASIARKYIADPALRSDAGRRVREKAVNECNMRESTRRYSELIRERLSALAGLV
jgi:glycosyltransferase involved in cell wall biosynthesis